MKYFLTICFFALMLTLNAEPIHDAASSGDLQAVKLLLTEDFSLLEKNDPNGFTPLLSACVAKKTEINGLTLIHFVFDSQPANVKDFDTISGLCYIAVPNDILSIHGVRIHTIAVAAQGYGGAEGVGYLVEADGLKIFHSGFHAAENDSLQKRRYKKQIDNLKAFGPVDFAFLTVSGHLSADYQPYLYLIDQLCPKAIYLMGGDQVTEEYPKCIEVLKARNVPVSYPDGGIAAGQRFHFMLK